MRIVFRVDSSTQMGSGHLMRCLTLANELRQSGTNVSFVSRLHPGHLIHKIETAGYVVHKLSAPLGKKNNLQGYEAWLGVPVVQDAHETLTVLDGKQYDWMIVDHYALDKTWESAFRVNANKIMVIDDLANRKHDCDLLLDQNYFGINTSRRYDKQIPQLVSRLLGPQFALLQPEYAQLRAASRLEKKQVENVLIFFGNADLENQTSRVLAALSSSKLRHLSLHVVVGSNHPDPDGLERQVASRGKVKFYSNLPTLADLMLQSDLVIGAGGGTTWERLCLGCPALVVSLAENQNLGAHFLSNDGYQIAVKASTLEDLSKNDWEQASLKLLASPPTLKKLAQKGQSLVDGLGVKRVALRLIGCENLKIFLRDATIDDEKLLLDWSNEPQARAQSFCQNLITAEEHNIWLNKKLLDSNALILIGESESGVPLGLVRFDLNIKKREAVISISIDVSMRGMGIAKKLLADAMKYCAIMMPAITFIAEVRDTNGQSQHLFKQLNFTQIDTHKMSTLRFEYPTESAIRERV